MTGVRQPLTASTSKQLGYYVSSLIMGHTVKQNLFLVSS